MTNFKNILLKLKKNFNILQVREAKYGIDVPLALLNQIRDHQQAITLTEQAIDGSLTEAEWREVLKPLNIDHALIEGGFFQKILHAHTTDQQRDLRNRQIMLRRVYDFWVKGVLENSLHNEVLIELGMETKPDAVDYPWEMVIRRPDRPNHALSPGTEIIDVFDESGGSLLILGEPGSGKTTMLLELARQLIARAQADPTQPLPVVFNLSSWVEKRFPLKEWLAEELNIKYSIPKTIARTRLENDELIFLLDGLDEVARWHRADCIKTINVFRQNHLISIAVCSRMGDYEGLSAKLSVQQAIVLQPLTSEQIDRYLNSFQAELFALRTALKQDAQLMEWAHSPLMLSIMTLAYKDFPAPDFPHITSAEVERHRLFETYVQQMFERRVSDRVYSSDLAWRWLIWLAQGMVEHSQTLFLLEWLQPSWLQSRIQTYTYAVGSTLGIGLINGLVFGLLLGLTEQTFSFSLAEVNPSEYNFDILTVLKAGLVGWLSFMIYYLLHFGTARVYPRGRFKWWLSLSGFDTSLRNVLTTVLWSGLISGLISGLLFRGFIPGLVIGLIVGLISPFLKGLINFGLTFDEFRTSLVPNQGVWTSLKNGLRLGLGVCMIGGLISSLMFWWSGLLAPATLIGLIFATGGLIAWMVGGGSAFIQHFVLRFILYRSVKVPWNLVPFLDYCVDRIFLRKVGGGYIFIHRYLMEYFASLTEEDIERLAGETAGGN